MKILFVSSSSGSRGGGELYLLFLAEALLKLNHEVALWCATHPRMDELAHSFSAYGTVFRGRYNNTYDYKLRSLHHLMSGKVEGLETAIKEFIPSIIHLNKQNLEDGLDLIKYLDTCSVPYVTTIHITQTQKSLSAFLGAVRDRVARQVLLNANTKKWIAIAVARSKDLSSFLKEDNRVLFVPNGVKIPKRLTIEEKTQFKQRAGISSTTKVVITVGRLESQKDPLRFIGWAKECLITCPDSIFYWIGDGTLRHTFENEVSKYSLSDCICCVGWQRDTSAYYALADIYIHTAQYEGLPFSLLEAMSWELPCVVTEELYADLNFKENVLGQGPLCLAELLKSEVQRESLRVNARRYIEENYSLNLIAASYSQLYKSITDV